MIFKAPRAFDDAVSVAAGFENSGAVARYIWGDISIAIACGQVPITQAAAAEDIQGAAHGKIDGALAQRFDQVDIRLTGNTPGIDHRQALPAAQVSHQVSFDARTAAFDIHGMNEKFVTVFGEAVGDESVNTLRQLAAVELKNDESPVTPPKIVRVTIVDAPGTIMSPSPQKKGAGDSPQLAGERIVRVPPDLEPRAYDVALIGADRFTRGETCRPVDAVPVYLRDRVVRAPGA